MPNIRSGALKRISYNNPMILGVNMAISPFSLGLWVDEKTHFETIKPSYHWDIENLIQNIQSFLKECGVELESVQKMCIALGPGSYTSLRLSLTTLKTIAMVHQIDVIGYPTLDALAYPFRHHSGVYYVLTPGKREDVNAALFTTHQGRLIRQSESIVWPFETCLSTLGRCEENFIVLGQFPEALKPNLKALPKCYLIEATLGGLTLVQMQLDGYPGEAQFEKLQPIYGHIPTLGPIKR